MRHWLFHPLVAYPLAALVAAAAVLSSLQPGAWPRAERAQAGRIAAGAVVIEGQSFGAPGGDPSQEFHIARDRSGTAQSLKIAVHPGLGSPGPNDRGVTIQLASETARTVAGQPVRMRIAYRSLQLNSATALAVRFAGGAPTAWATLPIEPGADELHFMLQAPSDFDRIALRAIGTGGEYNEGVEIVSIRIEPRPARA